MKERFGNERIERCRRQIRSGAEPTISLARDGWLAESWSNGEALSLALSRYLGERSALLKSHPGQGLDLFHDLGLRDGRADRVVLRSYDRSAGWRELSHASLIARALRPPCRAAASRSGRTSAPRSAAWDHPHALRVRSASTDRTACAGRCLP